MNNNLYNLPFNIPYSKYKFIILTINYLAIISTMPAQSFGINMFVDHWIKDFNVNRIDISYIWLIASILSGFLVIFFGKLVDHINLKLLVCIIYPIYCLSILMISFSPNIYILALCICLMRILGPESIGTITSVTNANWYKDNLGKINSILALLDTIFIASPSILNYFITEFGWRHTYIYLSIAITCLLIPSLLFIVKNPDNYKISDEEQNIEDTNETENEQDGIPFNTVIKNPIYWMMIISNFIFGLFWSGFNINAVDYFKNIIQFTSTQTSIIVFIPITVGVILGSISIGYFIDKYGNNTNKNIIGFNIIGMAICIIWYTFISNIVEVVFASLIYGILIGIYGTSMTTIYPNLYGLKEIGSIQAFHNGIVMFSTGLGPLFFNVININQGSYTYCNYYLSVILLLLGLIITKYKV